MPPTGRAWKRGKRDAKKVEMSGTFLLIKNMQTLFLGMSCPYYVAVAQFLPVSLVTYPAHSLVSHGSHVAREER